MLESIVALPGDEIEIRRKEGKELVIGPGLRKDNQNTIVSMKCGLLKKKENFFWLESHQKRYVPSRNEYVIGIAVTKSAETIKIDIGSSEYASLSFLAFENATKRNKPNVEIGDLLYCRVLTGNKDMEPELVCIDAAGKASGLGVLKDGFMFKINLELARRLLSGSNQFLRELSKNIPPFEITIGMNGRIWIKTSSCKQTIFLFQAINQYSNVSESDTENFIKNLLKDYSDWE
ncbi:unnamed protein product [Brachionus calyciflorus]|uniref:Exosome complex component RRP40 n=1 Tax=Brachionus calyciflorus TaxID=104777 RepID=A0A813M3J2_9BILA|nr:unnamed protein product [Brachionus calyciflorus]